MLKNGDISVHWKNYPLTVREPNSAGKPGHKHDPDLDHIVLLSQIMHVQYRKTLPLDEGTHHGPHRHPATVTP